MSSWSPLSIFLGFAYSVLLNGRRERRRFVQDLYCGDVKDDLVVTRGLLLLLFGDVGDTLLTTPAIRALRNRFPTSRLVAVGKPQALQILRSLDLVDDAIEVDKHLYDRPTSLLNPLRWPELLKVGTRIRKERADGVVLFHHLVTRWGTLKYLLLMLVSGASERIGLDNGRGWFFTRSLRDRGFGERHEVEYWLGVAGLLGASGGPIPMSPVQERDRIQAEDLLSKYGLESARLVAIHPGSGWYSTARRWQASRFAETARRLAAEDTHFVVVGTAEEADEARAVQKGIGRMAVNLAGETSLEELGAVLERCKLLIANDGGVAHLAAAVRTPTVVVFGPSNDRAWRPLSGKVVSAEVPCRPCLYRDFERGLRNGCQTRECMSLVTPQMVARAAVEVLREDDSACAAG